jgi:hypothetical protein
MSSEPHKVTNPTGAEPTNDTVGFEPRDIKASTIYRFLIVLAISVVLSYIVSIFVLRRTTRMAEESDTPPPPVRQEMGKESVEVPPEPRLQGTPVHGSDPQSDLRQKIQQDAEANQRIGWIDQSAGIVQIPVKDAMKIIAEKGLPAASTPQAENKGKKK